MTEYEAYQEHIRYTHDTYCRIVIRHASFDAARMLAARWKREISLEYLTEEKFVPLSAIDEYFQVPDYGETYPFSVRGQTIFLDSCSLAAALVQPGLRLCCWDWAITSEGKFALLEGNVEGGLGLNQAALQKGLKEKVLEALL